MNKLFKMSAVSILALGLVFGGIMSNQVASSHAETPVVTSTQVEQSLNKVIVNGSSTISLKPDLAYINIGVNTKDKVASVAQEANSKIMSDVIKALKNQGIDEKNISTENYSIYKQFDYEKEIREEYYAVSNMIKLKVTNLETIGELIDVAADAGANNINNIRFEVEDKSQAYNKALRLAMEDAKSKATAIMGTFGKMPGTPSMVTESSYSTGIFYDSAISNVAAEEMKVSTPISTKNIDVTANVSVEYSY